MAGTARAKSHSGRRSASWALLDCWQAPRTRTSWQPSDGWQPAYRELVSASTRQIGRELARWDKLLEDIGGEPSRQDWSRFRPLRLSREEDWSDWLAHLFQHSTTGRFAKLLLGEGLVGTGRVAEAGREMVAGSSRADLVLDLEDGSWVHVEVKIGDPDLAKTPDTGDALRRLRRGKCRGDVLLLMPEQESAWEFVRKEAGERATTIRAITWLDVARCLRQSLKPQSDLGASEDLPWRVWAVSFLGAVEQQLLGFEHVPPGGASERLRRARPSDPYRLEILTDDKEK